MTVVHHYLWWAPYSVLQQWAVILHRLLFPLLSLPLSPSWQRKKQEGLQGMATTEEIYLVRHWEKEEAGKAIPVRGRQMDVWCPRAACPQQFLLQLLPMMEWVGKWWDSMTEGQHRSPLDSFTGKREGKASFPPWPLASAPIYTEKQRDPGTYGITVFKCVLILTPIKATMHPKPPYYKHLQGVQRLLSTWSSVVIYQNILIVLQLLFWQILYSTNGFFPLVSKHLYLFSLFKPNQIWKLTTTPKHPKLLFSHSLPPLL